MEVAIADAVTLDGISPKMRGNPSIMPFRPDRDSHQKSQKHNVFVVAANRLLRDLLCERVAAGAQFSLVGSESAIAPGIWEMGSSGDPVVVLLWLSDISVPEQLLDQIGTVRKPLSRVRLVLLGMPATESIFLSAVRAGATGYVLDDAPMEEVSEAIRLVARGEIYCPSRLLPVLFRWVAAQPDLTWVRRGSNRYGLSRREWQLIPFIARGMTNKEIASELCLSEQTVKNHLHRMMRKAGAANRLAVVDRCQAAAASGM